MYIQQRIDRHGKPYFSFSYSDAEGRRIRLKKSDHPHFSSHEEASAWAKSQAAYRASEKCRIERKLSWKSSYYKFDELLQKYRTWQSCRAPNSFEMNVYYLEQFVFPFFLQEKRSSNVNMWHLLHQDFEDWLRVDAETVKNRSDGRKTIAIATANNVIKTLNTFMEFLSKYNLVDPDNVKKMKSFPPYMTNHRDISDVLSQAEYEELLGVLRRSSPSVADFVQVLCTTGLRFNEMFSLHYKALHAGQVRDESFHSELVRYGIAYFGYVLLENQARFDDRRRNPDGSIERKPLKGRKTMSLRDARVIPIVDVHAWNILVRRFKNSKRDFERGIYTKDPQDYCLFDDLEYNQAQRALKDAYRRMPRYKRKSYHCLRHTFCTNFVGKTRNYFLTQQILGHKTPRIFESYLHIHERLAISASQSDSEPEFVDKT